MKERYIKVASGDELGEDKWSQHKCGVVAVFSPIRTKHLFPLVLEAGDGVQNRGQNGAGCAVSFTGGFDTYYGDGLLREVFTDRQVVIGRTEQNGIEVPIFSKTTKDLDHESQTAIVHCRYGTSGDYNPLNLQPCIEKTPDGFEFAVAHNGEFPAKPKMLERLGEDIGLDVSDTYIFARLLAIAPGDTFDQKLLNTLSLPEMNGAYSLYIGVKNTHTGEESLYLARDPDGIRPLILGQKGNLFIAASETHALDIIGASIIREVKRGEILRIDKDGISVIKEGLNGPGHSCDFEWTYFTNPESQSPVYHRPDDSLHPERWLTAYGFRHQCGFILAEESPVPNASFVIGAPDSGVPAGQAYTEGLLMQGNKVPYLQLIIRDHYRQNGNKRLFLADREMGEIARKVSEKLCLINDPERWRNAVVVLVDDSIVRGNVSKQLVRAIFNLGAKEVHVKVASPMILYGCHLGISTRTQRELIAHRNEGDLERIRQEIGATSLYYISHNGYLRAERDVPELVVPRNPKELYLANHTCGGCYTGLYPISKDGVIYQSTG